MTAKPANVYEVYRCESPIEGQKYRRHTSFVAVRLDDQWEPVDPIPEHVVQKLGRFVATGKEEAIRDSKVTPRRWR